MQALRMGLTKEGVLIALVSDRGDFGVMIERRYRQWIFCADDCFRTHHDRATAEKLFAHYINQ